ncbi:MAG: sulfotransferase domain-containing protein, partial [Acidimicrobiia bacterium]|nr:sulfotransferase domain-containing protein [Acidimicrobiia bacterium]
MTRRLSATALRQKGIDALKRIAPVRMRRRLVRLRLRLRRVTARFRILPTFVILGGQRCGTSSLYKYLGQHPEIAPSLRKEIEYFTIDYGNGELWYRAHFPLALRRLISRLFGRSLVTFEATPDYLFDPRAPERLQRLLPEARLIVLLREPVSRAFSHYHHMARLGLDDLSFPDAIAAEESRLSGQLEEMKEDPLARVLPFRRYSYRTRGLYA